MRKREDSSSLRRFRLRWTLSALALLGVPWRADACDICAIYTATEQREARTGFRLGIAEQYTYFGTERLDSERVGNPGAEHMHSFVTQFLAGYTFNRRFGLQLSVPLIARSFRRIRDHRIEHGDETGVGDMALVGNLLAFSNVTEESVFRFSLLGGVKFPTGDPARLAEELPSVTGGATVAALRMPVPQHAAGGHGAPQTGGGGLPEEGGLHGHDLALGSGSYDGIVGGQIFWSRQRLFASAAMQYSIRTKGSFGYQFADDLTWVGGPGYFVALTHDYSVGLQAVISGETKGKDSQLGVTADDTGMTALYVGPGISLTRGTTIGADLAVDIPALQHNTSLQLVPDVRVRGGLTWRF